MAESFDGNDIVDLNAQFYAQRTEHRKHQVPFCKLATNFDINLCAALESISKRGRIAGAEPLASSLDILIRARD